jgi:hypothetical protein
MTTSAAEPRARESLYTKDARKLVWITLLCLFLQVLGQNWSAQPRLPGSTDVHELGFVQFEARPWIGWVLLTVGVTVLVWVLFIVQWQWVYWAVAHGDLHPFTIGDVSWSIQRLEGAP